MVSARRSTSGPAARRQSDVRDHNLALILGEVHARGLISRAELTGLTGLNRSTVGALVGDLQQLGLVHERHPGQGERAGRPSHLVAARDDGPYSIAVQFDVERVVVALVGLGGTVLGRTSRHLRHGVSPQDAVHTTRDALCELEGTLVTGARPCGIGISVPGTVRRADGVLRSAPNLGWREVPLAELVNAQLGPAHRELPVRVGNDADLAARAEHLRGAGRGVDNLVFLLGDVGVGGGILAGGVPVTGARGYGGEIGHMVVQLDGPACRCGGSGCFEAMVGGLAICRLAGPGYPPGRDGAARVIADARAGQPAAVAAVRVVAGRLGAGLAAIANMLDPQLIVVGGLLQQIRVLAAPEVDRSMAQHLTLIVGEGVTVCPPALGADSSLLGAAELGFEHLLERATKAGWRKPVGLAPCSHTGGVAHV